MAIRFREDPKSDEVDVLDNGLKIVKRQPALGEAHNHTSKTVFSDEPVRKLGTKGHWFELRVDDFLGGFLNICAIGFTATDPSTLCEDETPLPPRACEIPRTYLVGYTGCVCWDGQRVELENDPIAERLTPFSMFTLGVLLTPAGHLQVIINRSLAISVDPVEHELPPIPADEPLYAVVDLWGGMKRAVVMSSLPPSQEELDKAAELEKGQEASASPEPGAAPESAAAGADAATPAAEGDAAAAGATAAAEGGGAATAAPSSARGGEIAP